MRAFEAVSDETPKFYAMASAFYDFLVKRTGNPAIVAELAVAVRRGQPIERWLLTRTGHDKESDGIRALSADFPARIATDQWYGVAPANENRGGGIWGSRGPSERDRNGSTDCFAESSFGSAAYSR